MSTEKKYIEKPKFLEGKYRSLIIDTVNGLQNKLYLQVLKDKGKSNFDDKL